MVKLRFLSPYVNLSAEVTPTGHVVFSRDARRELRRLSPDGYFLIGTVEEALLPYSLFLVPSLVKTPMTFRLTPKGIQLRGILQRARVPYEVMQYQYRMKEFTSLDGYTGYQLSLVNHAPRTLLEVFHLPEKSVSLPARKPFIELF